MTNRDIIMRLHVIYETLKLYQTMIKEMRQYEHSLSTLNNRMIDVINQLKWDLQELKKTAGMI